ncbi:MAG: hypothetical protein DWI30_04570 [Chloroflexi bacterium]|nr:MAG: hypothetical protein DWI30_04570 [Chloroflexota bacterium]
MASSSAVVGAGRAGGLADNGVELVTQAQVRYIYTVVPLMATGLAAVLVPIWRKGWAGRVLVGVCIGFVAWVSLSLWVDAVLGLQKPRIDGLTH